MFVRPPSLLIPPTSPFQHDKLGRIESAERLSYLLEGVQPPFVLSIDGKYGNGKTTFVQMWKAHLKTKGFRTLYFNAWESDFASDPLIAFIGEMDAEIKQILGEASSLPNLSESWQKVKKAGAYLAKRAIPLGVKVSTAGILDLDKFTEQSIASAAEAIAKEQIEKYEGTKEKVCEFKTLLGKFIQSLAPQGQNKKTPLIFFVDELDRCRPPYAIELLERIKHFFWIEEIVFVLAMDKVQLASSIQAVYGKGIDVDGYLRRFVDLKYRLPAPATMDFLEQLFSQFHIDELMQAHGNELFVIKKELAKQTFLSLADALGLSLRTQEQCLARLAVILLTTKIASEPPQLILGLLALQAKDPALYNGFVNGERTVEEVLSAISRTPRGKQFLYEKEGVFFEIYLLRSRMNSDPSVGKLLDTYKVDQAVSDRSSARMVRADVIVQRVFSEEPMYDMVKEVGKMIAFASDFNLASLPGKITTP